MAHLACPCGNVLWNGYDDDGTVFRFVPDSAMKNHWEDAAFFDLAQDLQLSTELWNCDVCDRMLVFDDPLAPVSRYMDRVDSSSLSEADLEVPHATGICFNTRFRRDVEEYFAEAGKIDDTYNLATRQEKRTFPDQPLLTPRDITTVVFSNSLGRFRDWWYASLYDEFIVFYASFDESKTHPVKVWKRYVNVWTR